MSKFRVNIQKLIELRKTLGLSQEDLACAIGIDNYGKNNEHIKQTPAFSFALQHLYSISDKKPGLSDCLNILNIGPDTVMNCVFKYVGKHGKHHCFVSIRGGWSRTYTDTQLIGKFIQEVSL